MLISRASLLRNTLKQVINNGRNRQIQPSKSSGHWSYRSGGPPHTLKLKVTTQALGGCKCFSFGSLVYMEF